MGARGPVFAEVAANWLRDMGYYVDYANHSANGGTVGYVYRILSEASKWPDVVVLMFGNADGKTAVAQDGRFNLLKWMPARYRTEWGLDPRPYFSTRWYRRWPQYLDSWSRLRLKLTLARWQGVRPATSFDHFKLRLGQICDLLRKRKADYVLMCSTVLIEERWFPGSIAVFDAYNDLMRQACCENGFTFVDMQQPLRQALERRMPVLAADRFHPNDLGHWVMGEALFAALCQAFPLTLLI